MKYIYILSLLLTSCFLHHSNSDNCKKEFLSLFLKCDKNLPHEDVLVYIDIKVENDELKVMQLLGELTPKGNDIISSLIECSNSFELEKFNNCQIRFVYDRQSVADSKTFSNRLLEINTFKKQHKLVDVIVVNSVYKLN